MNRWTKIEAYTSKAIAWTMLRERLRSGCGPIEGFADQVARDLRVDYGGLRSGKTERARRMGFDIAKGRDKSVRAKWINGRLWILD